MNAKKIKRFRKSIERLDPLSYIKSIKEFKESKGLKWLCNNIPAEVIAISKKRHAGESLADFGARRKKCNARRRERESLMKRPS